MTGDPEEPETAEPFDNEERTHADPAPELPAELPPELVEESAPGPLPELPPETAPELPLELVEERAPEASVDLSPRLESILESLLFAADKPLSLAQLAQLVGESDVAKVRQAVEAIEAHAQSRGVQLQAIAGGYQFRTHPDNAVWVQKLLAQRPVRLTRAQLETLAICAYRQPITRPEIDEIRGVDSGGTLKTLMDRSLIRILGKKEEPGRPMIYGTTRDFLEFFNLGDLKDLPTLREFHELSEEHRAQVEALESAAPEGSVETAEEAAAAERARMPLERVSFSAPPEDADELAEIDRLIQTAGGGKIEAIDPAGPAGPAGPAAQDAPAQDDPAPEKTDE